MANNFLRSLALVSAVALIPAATAALAAVDVDTGRELDQFMSVFERVKSEYVEQVDDETLIRGAIDGMLAQPRSAQLLSRRARLSSALMTTTDGNYGGLGLTVTMEDGAVKVVAADRGQPGRPGRDQGRRLHHPSRRQADLRRHARRGGRPDARRRPAPRQASPSSAPAATSRSTSPSPARSSSSRR